MSTNDRRYAALGSNAALTSVWAVTRNNDNGYPYKSTDLGVTFTQVSAAPFTGGGIDFAAAAVSDNGNVVALSTFGGNLYVSTNGGSSFTAYSATGGDEPAVALNADGSRIYTIHRGGPVKVSTDFGVSSTALPNSLPTIASQGAPADINGGAWYWFGISTSTDGTKIAASGRGNNNFGGNYQGNLISVSLDSGATWTAPNFAGMFQDWFGTATSASGAVMVATASATAAQGSKNNAMTNSVWLSTNTGTSWTQHIPASGGVVESASFQPCALSADGKTIVVGTDGGYLWMFNR